MGHTLYIDGPDDGGEGIYHLVADTGEHLASHVCSERSWARFDVHGRRTAQHAAWRQRFGEYRVAFVGDGITAEELQQRNEAWAMSEPQP